MRALQLLLSPWEPEIFIKSTIYVAYAITKLSPKSVASVIFPDCSNIRCDAAGINPAAWRPGFWPKTILETPVFHYGFHRFWVRICLRQVTLWLLRGAPLKMSASYSSGKDVIYRAVTSIVLITLWLLERKLPAISRLVLHVLYYWGILGSFHFPSMRKVIRPDYDTSLQPRNRI